MALVPLLPDLEEKESPELVDLRRRFCWSSPLTLAIVLVATA